MRHLIVKEVNRVKQVSLWIGNPKNIPDGWKLLK